MDHHHPSPPPTPHTQPRQPPPPLPFPPHKRGQQKLPEAAAHSHSPTAYHYPVVVPARLAGGGALRQRRAAGSCAAWRTARPESERPGCVIICHAHVMTEHTQIPCLRRSVHTPNTVQSRPRTCSCLPACLARQRCALAQLISTAALPATRQEGRQKQGQLVLLLSQACHVFSRGVVGQAGRARCQAGKGNGQRSSP